MKPLKILAVSAVAAFALALGVGTASANPLTSPKSTSYTSTLKAESSNWKLSGTFTTVECKGSTLEGKVESHTELAAEGSLSNLTFKECNFATTVKKPGSLEIQSGSEGKGAVVSSGAEISIETSVGTCVFTTNNTLIGTVTGTGVTGSNAVLDLSEGLPRTAGNFLCGASGSLSGSYKFTTPSTLYVDEVPNPLTSPEGTQYKSTIKAESGTTKLSGAFATVECTQSTAEGKVETTTAAKAGGKLTSLTFANCNFPVTVKKAGSLEIEAIGGGNGTVRSSEAEVEITTSLGPCIFTTSSTDIGTLTGTGVTGGNATLDINGAMIPRTAGNYLCGSSGTWNGSYKVTTPSTLYVDTPPPAVLTSPKGTSYGGQIKGESGGEVVVYGPSEYITTRCKTSTLEAQIESQTKTRASGKVTNLSFGECNHPFAVTKTGSLEIESIGGGKGTVISTGTEMVAETSQGTCVYTTSGTDIGTLTGTGLTGGNAVLDLSSALPRTAGNFLCGSTGTLSGSYKFTTPSTLYVD